MSRLDPWLNFFSDVWDWIDAFICLTHSKAAMLTAYAILIMVAGKQPVPQWIKTAYITLCTVWILCSKEDTIDRRKQD